jgi:BlaI family transcriptional regulator, penicillinase repressor
MARKAQDVTEAELAVLQVLWHRRKSTIRDLAAVLAPNDQDGYYASVKKFLERLEAKGFVRREPQGIAYLYEATVGRDELVGQRLKALSESLCEGSVTPLLTQLAQHERLSKKQQTALLSLIEELANETETPRPSPGKSSGKSRGKRR